MFFSNKYRPICLFWDTVQDNLHVPAHLVGHVMRNSRSILFPEGRFTTEYWSILPCAHSSFNDFQFCFWLCSIFCTIFGSHGTNKLFTLLPSLHWQWQQPLFGSSSQTPETNEHGTILLDIVVTSEVNWTELNMALTRGKLLVSSLRYKQLIRPKTES